VAPRLSAPPALVFAGDHGIARRGVSAYPPEVTAQMVANFVRGGAAISVLARREGFSLTVVDAGVDAHFAPDPRLIDAKVRRGTRDFGFESAMTPAECREALARAERIVDGIAARGSNTLVLGEMGIGNTASASVLMHGLTGLALPDCVGRGTGLDDRGLARKVELLSAACARCAPPGGTGASRLAADHAGAARPGPRHASRGRERCGARTLPAARGARALLRYGDVRAGGRERAQRMSAANPPALCSWSGGKDSCLALHLALESGIPVTRLLTVFEPDADRSRSHALPLELLADQAAALGLELRSPRADWATYERVFVEELEQTGRTDVENIHGAGGPLRQVRGLGAGGSMDELGTGYSGMSYVERLRINTLRIDGSFISKMNSHENA